LIQAYKTLYLNKAQSTIFGPKANIEKSREKKDPNTIEINEIPKKKEKTL